MALPESVYPRMSSPLGSPQVQTFWDCKVGLGDILNHRDVPALWENRECCGYFIMRYLCLQCAIAEYERLSQKGLQTRRLPLLTKILWEAGDRWHCMILVYGWLRPVSLGDWSKLLVVTAQHEISRDATARHIGSFQWPNWVQLGKQHER